MDNFRIPKKINRQVLKAINYLSPTGLVTTQSITNQVAYQLRNGVPVASLDHVIMMSLSNMTALSLLRCENGKFGINRVLDVTRSSTSSLQLTESSSTVSVKQSLSLQELDAPPEPIPPMKSYKVPKREEPDKRDLDPASKVKRCSDESLTGDEIERVRKRFRANKHISRYGGPVLLPKKCEHTLEERSGDSQANLPCFKQRHALMGDGDGDRRQHVVSSTVRIGPIQYCRTMCIACEERLRIKYQQTKTKAFIDKKNATVEKSSSLHVKHGDDLNDVVQPEAVQETEVKQCIPDCLSLD